VTTSTDGAPPSVAPEPDGGSGPAGDSSLRRSRERPPRDETDEGVDTGPGWLREEIQRRIAEGRSRSGGRHARRDSVSPGSIGYVPRHSVATPGPGAPPPGPVGGSPAPHASELPRRERTEANRAGPAPAAWSGPLGAPAENPAPETDGAAPAADPTVDQRPEASAAAPPAPPQPSAPPVSPPSPSPQPAPAAPTQPVDPAPAVQAPPDGSATGPGAVTPQQASAATAPDVEPTTTDAIPGEKPDAATPGPSAAAPAAAETAPAPTRPRPARPSPGPAWLGEPPSTVQASGQAPVAPVPPAPEPPATEEPAAAAGPPASAEPSAVQATAPTAPVVPGRPVLGDPVFTARTPQPGTREWDVVDPVHVPEQRAADDPNDLQSRRVRVVLAERRGVARPVRTVVDIQEGTGVGEFLRNDLIKTQLSIALRFATGAALTLGLLPLLFAMIPEIGHIELLGIRLPWLVLGLLVYPFLFGIGLWYSRLAEKVEQNFADHVQD
jgi:hypothetical protein